MRARLLVASVLGIVTAGATSAPVHAVQNATASGRTGAFASGTGSFTGPAEILTATIPRLRPHTVLSIDVYVLNAGEVYAYLDALNDTDVVHPNFIIVNPGAGPLVAQLWVDADDPRVVPLLGKPAQVDVALVTTNYPTESWVASLRVRMDKK